VAPSQPVTLTPASPRLTTALSASNQRIEQVPVLSRRQFIKPFYKLAGAADRYLTTPSAARHLGMTADTVSASNPASAMPLSL
jgi:hypothetical protein